MCRCLIVSLSFCGDSAAERKIFECFAASVTVSQTEVMCSVPVMSLATGAATADILARYSVRVNVRNQVV
jgi:hypothetical protein